VAAENGILHPDAGQCKLIRAGQAALVEDDGTILLPLLTSGEVMAVREHFNEGDVLLEEASAELILLCTRAEQVRAFVQVLEGHAEFRPGDNGLPAGAEPGLGDIGRPAVGCSGPRPSARGTKWSRPSPSSKPTVTCRCPGFASPDRKPRTVFCSPPTTAVL